MALFWRFGFFLLIFQNAFASKFLVQADVQEAPTPTNTDILKDIQARLLAIEQTLAQQYTTSEAHFKKLKQAEMVIQARDIVRGIARRSFKFVEEKMLEIKEPAVISEIVSDVYAGSECNFGVLIDFTKSLTSTRLKSQVLNILFEEVTLNNHTNTLNMIALAKALKPVAEESDFEYSNATTPFQTLVAQFEANTVERLTDVMQSDENYEHNPDVKALSAAIADWPHVSANVMVGLVRITFRTVNHSRILEAVSSHADTFQAMVGVGELFRRLKGTNSFKDNIVLNIVSHFSEIMNRTGYSQFDSRVKNTAERVVADFPVCARNLFYQPSFCIWNKLQDSYVVASDSAYTYDDRRRNIFTSPRMESGTTPKAAKWRLKRNGDKLFFESDDYANEFFYAADIKYDVDFNYVFSWIPGHNMDDQSAWTLEIDGDYCYLKNVYFDHYLRASSKKHRLTQQSYVFSQWKRASDRDKPDFIWQIRSC